MDIIIKEFHDKRSRSLVLIGVIHSVEFLSEDIEVVGYNFLCLGDLRILFYFTVLFNVFLDDNLGGIAVIALDLPDVLPHEMDRLELPYL